MRGVVGLAFILVGLGWAYAIAIGRWPPQTNTANNNTQKK